MTFYRFEGTPFDEELSVEIQRYLDTLPPDSEGKYPYIDSWEIFEGRGVWIRRLTHYPDDFINQMAREFEATYDRVAKKYRESDGHRRCR